MPKTRPPYPSEFRRQMAELARASPEEVERILGKLAQRSAIEAWIAQAEELSKGQNG